MRCPRCNGRDLTMTELGDLCMECEADDRDAGIHRYEVRRHGGRSNCSWRTLYRGTDRAKADAAFTQAHAALRQGALELTEDGKALRMSGAPLLRTRW